MSYFFWGSAYESGSKGIVQYGLYNWVIDRFVLVHHDPLILHTIQKLFSSRYQLILCCLHSAENFCPGLIDNQVCYNWSLRRVSSLRATRFPEFDMDPLECSYLVECEDFDPREQIWKDREYFWMVACYVVLFSKHMKILDIYHPFISEELPIYASTEFSVIDQPNLVVELRRKIYTVFYRTFDWKAAEAQVNLIMQNGQENYYGIDDISQLDLSIDRS